MRSSIGLALATVLLASSAHAEGDAEKGEKLFMRCKTCHSIIATDGSEIVKGGKIGPNLYGAPGRAAAMIEDFRYGDGLIAAAEKGLVWDAESFAGYVADPKGFLKEYLGEKSVQAKMAFRLPKGAEDVYAYLQSVSPEPTN